MGVYKLVTIDTQSLQQAEDLFASNQAPRALALLAAVLREDPANQLVADRLLAALSERNWPRLMEVSNTSVEPDSGRLPCRSPDGTREFRRTEDQSGRLYDTRTGQPLSEPMKVGNGIVISAEFSLDGRRVTAFKSERMPAGSFQRLAFVFDVLPGQCRGEPVKADDPVLKGTAVRSFPFVTSNKTIRIWDAATSRPSSESGLFCFTNLSVKVWEVETGNPLNQHHLGNPVTIAQFSPDGRRRISQRILNISVLDERTVQLLDGATRQPLSEPLKQNQPIKSAWLNRNGERIVVVLSDGTGCTWDLPRCSVPVPAWLPDLAEAVAGMRMNEKSVATNVPWAKRLKIQQQLAEAPATDACSRWVKWFLADRSTRAISPFSSMTVPDYVERRIQENTMASLQEAVRLSPTNGLAYARLAKLVLAQNDEDNPRRVGEAEFFSRYALKWSPEDAEVAKIRGEIEAQLEVLKKP